MTRVPSGSCASMAGSCASAAGSIVSNDLVARSRSTRSVSTSNDPTGVSSERSSGEGRYNASADCSQSQRSRNTNKDDDQKENR